MRLKSRGSQIVSAGLVAAGQRQARVSRGAALPVFCAMGQEGCSRPALGAALYWITPFNPWQAALIAFTICLMGFFGGLVMSAIKRDRGVKDWGTMIEGHGGMLDRLDSVIFAAPIFFHLTRYWWVP